MKCFAQFGGVTNLKAKGAKMSVLDLTKATVVCGSIAFLVYSFPVIGQVVIIGILALVWFTYAKKMIRVWEESDREEPAWLQPCSIGARPPR